MWPLGWGGLGSRQSAAEVQQLSPGVHQDLPCMRKKPLQQHLADVTARTSHLFIRAHPLLLSVYFYPV